MLKLPGWHSPQLDPLGTAGDDMDNTVLYYCLPRHTAEHALCIKHSSCRQIANTRRPCVPGLAGLAVLHACADCKQRCCASFWPSHAWRQRACMPIHHQPQHAFSSAAVAAPSPLLSLLQFDVTKERVIALIDADQSMLQTLAEGVSKAGGVQESWRFASRALDASAGSRPGCLDPVFACYCCQASSLLDKDSSPLFRGQYQGSSASWVGMQARAHAGGVQLPHATLHATC